MSDWHEVAEAGDVPEGGTLRVDCGDQPLCLYKLNGEIFATHDTCTHGQASLADGFVVDDALIECPLHQGSFDIRTGRVAGAPCKVDIAIYPVKLDNGKVFVSA